MNGTPEIPSFDPAAVERFDRTGESPVITRIDESTIEATFVLRSDAPATVLLISGFSAGSASRRTLLRVDDRTVARTWTLDADYRGTYVFWSTDSSDPLPEDDHELIPLIHSSGEAIPDPCNERTFTLPPDPDHPGFEGMTFSVAQGPATHDVPDAGVALRNELTEHRFELRPGEPTRRVWLHATDGVTPETPGALLLLFDGGLYSNVMSTPSQVERLVADGIMPPTVTVYVHYIDDESRNRELLLDQDFCDAVASHLIPWAAEQHPITGDPKRSIVGGFSLGGVGALGMGLWHPERFSNVIAQSCPWSVYPGVDLFSDDASRPDGFWITDEWERNGNRDATVYLEMGTSETIFSELAPFAARLANIGLDVETGSYNGGHDYLSWSATLPGALRSIVDRW